MRVNWGPEHKGSQLRWTATVADLVTKEDLKVWDGSVNGVRVKACRFWAHQLER
jgi:hypothetical protein